MQSSEAEILAQIQRAQAEFIPLLPAEIGLMPEEVAAVQIRAQVLRARLEISPDQQQSPLSLTLLLALLVELIGHADALSMNLDDAEAAHNDLLQTMRHLLLTGDAASLRTVLDGQRRSHTTSARNQKRATPPG